MNPKRGAVAFAPAGPGAYLRFDLDALATIEVQFGEEWWMGVMTSLDRGVIGVTAPAKLVKTLLDVSLFDAKGGLVGSAAFDLPSGAKEAYEPLRDALAWAVNGTDYATAVKEINERAIKASTESGDGGQEEVNPPKPVASLNGSGAAPTA